MHTKPEAKEYAPYYATYVNSVPEGDILKNLSQQVEETVKLVKDISNEQSLFRYAPDKWTVKEVLGHIVDTERIMGYRALCIARGETSALPGYDDEFYVRNASFNNWSIQEHIENLRIVRQSTIQLLKGLNTEAWLRIGNANGFEVSVRAIAYIIAGHERHHRQLLKERYLL